MGITQAIVAAGDQRRALKIDLATTWWSTRLYLIAALAERLTQARRILVVDTAPAQGRRFRQRSVGMPRVEERFVGQLSMSGILKTIGPKCLHLANSLIIAAGAPDWYNEGVTPKSAPCLTAGVFRLPRPQGRTSTNKSTKVNLTPELLRRWFGDALLQQPMHITDLQRASGGGPASISRLPERLRARAHSPCSRPSGPASNGARGCRRQGRAERAARSELSRGVDGSRAHLMSKTCSHRATGTSRNAQSVRVVYPAG